MKHRNLKKGLSLAEVVVAMALVVLISLEGFSVVNFSLNAGNKLSVESFFVEETKNYITAYYSGEYNYANALNLLTNQTHTFGTDATIFYSNNFQVTSEDNSKYYIKLTFNESNFMVECFNNQNNLIYKAEV